MIRLKLTVLMPYAAFMLKVGSGNVCLLFGHWCASYSSASKSNLSDISGEKVWPDSCSPPPGYKHEEQPALHRGRGGPFIPLLTIDLLPGRQRSIRDRSREERTAERIQAQPPLTLCWAAKRKKQRRWRTEPGRPSQRPSILWGILVSVCVTTPVMWLYWMIKGFSISHSPIISLRPLSY